MYECPNCAANLKFDIGRQMLYCEHCETTIDPYSFHKETDAEENSDYQVTVFTCPQCGGEIISEDTTAATFCSFCGSSTILDSRISKEKRPGYIIPFSKTMKDCKNSYEKMLNHAIFAPKELKDKNHIEKFRGIYMPYWVYSFENKGTATFQGSRTRRWGDYLYTKHYQLESQIDSEYQGIAFDASSTFSDSLSGAIAPFDTRNGKPFTPSFLSGFYADTSDVDDNLYQEEAQTMVVNDSCRQIKKLKGMSHYNAASPKHLASLRNALRPKTVNAELAMFPVWFLSYRKDNRIAYAVVNGQTGRAAADLPVDTKKYLIYSLILALPLFVLLNLIFTFKPSVSLILSALLAFVCTIVSNVQLSRIIWKENGTDDIGLQAVQEAQKPDAALPKTAPVQKENQAYKRILIKLLPLLLIPFVSVFIGILVFAAALSGSSTTLFLSMRIVIAAIILIPIIMLLAKKGHRSSHPGKSYSGNWKQKLPVLIKPLVGIILAVVILIVNPVSDLFYYGGAIICMGMVCWAILDIIKQHNVLTTRKLPQLNKRGGDELA